MFCITPIVFSAPNGSGFKFDITNAFKALPIYDENKLYTIQFNHDFDQWDVLEIVIFPTQLK